MKKVFIFLSVIALFALFSICILFSFKSFESFDFGEKLWIHHTGYPMNSWEGIEASAAQGYQNLECDVHYIEAEDRFLLTHDWPPQGKSLYLDEVMASQKNKSSRLWLDYKNAKIKNVFKASAHLRELEEKYNFKNRYMVESTNHAHQIVLSWLKINSVMWLRDYKRSRISWLRKQQDKVAVALGNFIAVSFSIESYSVLEKSYRHLPKLIFTVKDISVQKQLLDDATIKVVLIDLPGERQ